MKKYMVFLFCGLLVSCSKFLEESPKGLVQGSAAIADVTGLEAALTGSYKGLARTWSRGFINSSTQGFGMGGDDLTTLFGGNKAEFRQIDQFAVTSSNGHIAMIWNGCYKTIQGANNVIENAPGIVPIAATDQATINQILGEAYYLRALSYYWLVRGFGPIPLLTKVEYVVTTELLNMTKSEPIDVYKVIESDLAIAETLVGNTKRDPGRPNKGTVKALMADVYLTEAGWPIKDASKYAMAASKAKEVIDNKATYGFELVDFAVLWAGNVTAIGTKEEVMAIHTSENYGGSTNSMAGAPTVPAEEGGWEDYHAEINFFNNFPAGKRKDITFYTVFHKADGTLVEWQNSIAKHPYYGKFRIEHNDRWYSSMPVHLMRYAHVLLIYAEAQARATGTPNADAYKALNEVRKRAGLGDAPTNLGGPAFADAVVMERAWEFAGEATTRWFDLIRLEKVEEANSNKNAADLQPIGTITKDDYWFPVPLGDASVNPNL
ncbi:RagB/SusD family nutrient uptake outer membrane protein [Chitinophaga sp. MM2321]|uniref:RagB/SusD family nutrient uptake outer membrane protein n=1 Tax=Chitinophaga sp. MM2321 TaxID=3137178 RepID=UPI0032D5706F